VDLRGVHAVKLITRRRGGLGTIRAVWLKLAVLSMRSVKAQVPRAPPRDNSDVEWEKEDFNGDGAKAFKCLMQRMEQACKQNTVSAFFWRLNKSRTGYVSAAEFADGMQKIAHSQASDRMLRRLFRRMDADRDGALIYKDFLAHLREQQGRAGRKYEWQQRAITARHGPDMRHVPGGSKAQQGSRFKLPTCFYTPRPPNRSNILVTGTGRMLGGGSQYCL